MVNASNQVVCSRSLSLSLSLYSAISKMPRYEAGINRKRCASEKLTQDQAMTNSLRSGLGQLWAKQICWTSCPMPVFSCLASRDRTLNFRYWWNHWCIIDANQKACWTYLYYILLSLSYLFVVPCFIRLSHPRSSHVCGGRLDEQRVWSLQHELFKTVNAVKTLNTRNLKSCYKITDFFADKFTSKQHTSLHLDLWSMHHKGCTAFGVPNSCGDAARAFGAKSPQRLLEKAILTPWRLRTFVLTWCIWSNIYNILQYGFASFFASSSAGQIRTGSGECVAVQDVADVWGSPAVDLDRALTKAPETSRCMVGGADGTKAPTCTS